MKRLIIAMIVGWGLFYGKGACLVFAETDNAPSKLSGLPMELTWENKKVVFSAGEKELVGKTLKAIELMGNGKDIEKTKKAAVELNKIIEENPEYSDAYFLRATISYDGLHSQDYPKIIGDINTAIKLHSSSKYKNFSSVATMYSTRAKIYKQMGNYKQALEDFEKAINMNLSENQGDVISVSGVKAEEAKPNDTWTKKDFDEIINRFPSDYRGHLFRGYFYSFFTSFNEKYYAPAIKDYEEAIRLNPKSALSYYLLGELYKKSAFWKKDSMAEVSGKVANGYNEKAIQVLIKPFY